MSKNITSTKEKCVNNIAGSAMAAALGMTAPTEAGSMMQKNAQKFDVECTARKTMVESNEDYGKLAVEAEAEGGDEGDEGDESGE